MDGVYDDDEYRRQKRTLEMELESLVVPEADAAGEAGRLIEKLPELWAGSQRGRAKKAAADDAGGRLRRYQG